MIFSFSLQILKDFIFEKSKSLNQNGGESRKKVLAKKIRAAKMRTVVFTSVYASTTLDTVKAYTHR